MCSLSRDPRVRRMIDTFKMEMINIDGCMLGLKSSRGKPIMKPWTLRSIFPELVKIFSLNCICDKSHVHDLAAGCETAKTACYPQLMCDKIHQSIRAYVGYHTSDPDPPKSSQVSKSDADRGAWLMEGAQITEQELSARFEPEPDVSEHLPDTGTRPSAVQADSGHEGSSDTAS